MSEINVVPYIDVMLVLLVIFMITAPLMAQGVKVNLPAAKAQAVDASRVENLIVTVDRAGKYYLDDRPIAAGALVDRVAGAIKANPKSSVQVRGDREANYGDVVKLMALLQDAGVPSVGLLTEPPPRKK
ncbi:MAG TPA: protein TolR [Burkholderiales bacterium]|nr:protein TolR [Burkholderiales bacterium]